MNKKKNIIKKIILYLKENIISFILLLFTICLIIFSKNNLLACKEGLLLWAYNVIPSLLPFFIATELLSKTNIINKLGKLLEPIMRPIFNIPGIGSFPLIMGIISGYPTGAKIVSDLKKQNLCTNEEAERMIAFTNNSGPLFILSMVGITMFGNGTIGFLLLITHILGCITVGFIFKFWKNKNNINIIKEKNIKYKNQNIYISNLGETLSNAITSSINTILIIGGFIVIFSIILSMLKSCKIIEFFSIILFPIFKIFGINNNEFISAFISGLIELTNGLSMLTAIPSKKISINIILSAFLLGFGGLSVLLQVYSIISKEKISIKPYIIGKILHGFFSSTYTYLLIYCFPIFNLNL